MIDNLGFALEGAWKVLLVGLVLGAGLPAVFAVGIRSLAWGAGGAATAGGPTGLASAPPHPVGRALAVVCFLAVLAGIALGLTIIVAAGQGKVVSFDHVYPAVVDKPA